MQPGNRLERLIVMGPRYFRGDSRGASAHAAATSATAGAESHAGTPSVATGTAPAHAGTASPTADAAKAEPPCHEATYGEGDTSIEVWRSKPVRRLTWDAMPVNLPEFVSRFGSSSS